MKCFSIEISLLFTISVQSFILLLFLKKKNETTLPLFPNPYVATDFKVMLGFEKSYGLLAYSLREHAYELAGC